MTISPSKLQQVQTKQRVYLTASLLLLDVCVVLRLVLLAGCRTWRRVRVMQEPPHSKPVSSLAVPRKGLELPQHD